MNAIENTTAVAVEYDEDLYLKEVELEKEMTQEGMIRYQAKVASAKASGRESETSYGVSMIRSLTEKVAGAIENMLIAASSGKAGRRHASIPYLATLDNHVAAYISLRCVVSGISRHRPLLEVMVAIGSALEDEARFCSLREQDKKLYNSLAERAAKRVSYRNKKALVVHVANRENIEWNPWPVEDKRRIGEKMIEIISETTGLVEIEAQLHPTEKKTVNILVPTEQAREWMTKREDLDALLSPVYQPMIVPPAPWSGTKGGGYLTNFVRPLTLVKAGKNVLTEIDNAEMPLVYSAINAMQETAWKINTRILEIQATLYESGAEWAGIPSGVLKEIPLKPADIDTNEEARKAWRSAAAKVHEANALSKSARLSFNTMRNIAEKFSEFDRIYFPYTMDFRGRVYAVPQLNPQGSDNVKSLLHFAEAKPLGAHGYRWLCIHGANLAGVDKVPFEDRVAFIEANVEEIKAIAEDPISTRSWVSGFASGSQYEKEPGKGLGIDKPWQFLSFCLEFSDMLKAEGEGTPREAFPSRLAVALDGSCSGIQHYSMALRDPVGGRAVNLLPADKPSDIYGLVAQEVLVAVRSDASGSGDDAVLARQWLDFGITRKECKRPVMTFPYGSGQFGYRNQIMEDLMRPLKRKLGDDAFPFEDGGNKAAGYLAKQIHNALPKVVTKAAEGMAYLKKAAKIISDEGLPVQWTTPLGFPVFQAKYVNSAKYVNTMLMGRRVRVLTCDPTLEIDKTAQAGAVAPNFIHSLDAAHLQLTVVRAKERGINSMALIHDSFGTHAADTDVLFTLVRETMLELYTQHNPFERFRNEIRSKLSEENQIKLDDLDAECYPQSGGMDLSQILNAPYAFA